MDYELAKQLKDAGFPQEGKGDYFMDPACGPDADDDCMKDGHSAYFPTLSELIEACAPYFEALYCEPRISRGDEIIEEGGWTASARLDDIRVHSATPEDAVARLWLALHK